ncbi:hypothetical protein K437DRAFT_136459 [Tilletiaria anomala UBC 951]|uniref:Uncharacterized protein n=1 Tax=Tilletiaria anomala (strain ATCC 24038 / CBS 436.72 / UBC 951) TaxID=1037660 RepID=A0A066VW88_TILAU|nr:uncharacterized protein K437DRAFT_136459 [Tilletiaria anomala UBC 951]KDN44553.1 hypothetical protein K437DRAFT_136459 [Tilletiaria anomala UBC 951]
MRSHCSALPAGRNADVRQAASCNPAPQTDHVNTHIGEPVVIATRSGGMQLSLPTRPPHSGDGLLTVSRRRQRVRAARAYSSCLPARGTGNNASGVQVCFRNSTRRCWCRETYSPMYISRLEVGMAPGRPAQKGTKRIGLRLAPSQSSIASDTGRPGAGRQGSSF